MLMLVASNMKLFLASNFFNVRIMLNGFLSNLQDIQWQPELPTFDLIGTKSLFYRARWKVFFFFFSELFLFCNHYSEVCTFQLLLDKNIIGTCFINTTRRSYFIPLCSTHKKLLYNLICAYNCFSIMH